MRSKDFRSFRSFRGTKILFRGKADDCGTIKLLSAWGNSRPAEIAEIAEMAAHRAGKRISFISFISSTSEAAKPMTAGQ